MIYLFELNKILRAIFLEIVETRYIVSFYYIFFYILHTAFEDIKVLIFLSKLLRP